MQLHQLETRIKRRRQRIGRGGKRGTTSGRGQKGQKSRSGHRMRPAQRDLILRLPKRRGFRNKPKSEAAAVVNLQSLESKMRSMKEKPSVIDKNFLKKSGLVPGSHKGDVKILGVGDMGSAMEFRGLKVSLSAKSKIEKAGGKITV